MVDRVPANNIKNLPFDWGQVNEAIALRCALPFLRHIVSESLAVDLKRRFSGCHAVKVNDSRLCAYDRQKHRNRCANAVANTN